MSKPFRFAVQSFNADSGQAWRDKARKVEGLGYTALHLADHIIGPGPALAKTPCPDGGCWFVGHLTGCSYDINGGYGPTTRTRSCASLSIISTSFDQF